MSDLRELYQQVILDHNRAPRNFKVLESANRVARGDNPLCGDKLTLFVNVEGDVVKDIAFQGSGCAISKASTSLMTSAVKGKTVDEAQRLFDSFLEMVTGQGDSPSCDSPSRDSPSRDSPSREQLGKLVAFAGVRQFPARVKCASLAWHTLRAALQESGEAVSTE